MVFNWVGTRGLVCSTSSGEIVLLLNPIINPYYHSCVFTTDIYLTISLSTHDGDDTPQNYGSMQHTLQFLEVCNKLSGVILHASTTTTKLTDR